MSHYLTSEPISVERLIARVSAPARGGTAAFVGTVRAGPGDGPVTSIEYSAYPEMLEREMNAIVGETVDRWPDADLAVQHRIGIIPLGEASVAVVAAAPHREEAFAACRYIIEEIKRRLPVWKKEYLADGETRWRENAAG